MMPKIATLLPKYFIRCKFNHYFNGDLTNIWGVATINDSTNNHHLCYFFHDALPM